MHVAPFRYAMMPVYRAKRWAQGSLLSRRRVYELLIFPDAFALALHRSARLQPRKRQDSDLFRHAEVLQRLRRSSAHMMTFVNILFHEYFSMHAPHAIDAICFTRPPLPLVTITSVIEML